MIHTGTHGHNKAGVARRITIRDDTVVAHWISSLGITFQSMLGSRCSSTGNPSRYMKSTCNNEVNESRQSSHSSQGLLRFSGSPIKCPLAHCVHDDGCHHAHVVILWHTVPLSYRGVINFNCLHICWRRLSLATRVSTYGLNHVLGW